MAQKALQLIQDGQVIFLDVSTSMTLLAGLLNKEVTVYSHSLDNAIQLSSHSQVDFHLLGGNSTLKTASTMTRIKHKYWTIFALIWLFWSE